LCLGYKVSGSDIQESKYTKLVSSLGADIFIGHKKENIKDEPIVVVSSAIKEDNPELKYAKEKGLKIMHRSDCLKFISEQFPCFIGLAGTHGKTTMSGFLSFVLEEMKQNPSYAIGGIIPKLNVNALASKNSKFFVAELDESDGTIQKYAPNYLVINNLEEDHLDYYKNGMQDILPTFEKTISNMKDNSFVFLNMDNIGCVEFKNQTQAKSILTYSIYNEADYRASNILFDDLNSSFDVYKKGVFLGRINLIIPGMHNVYNALAIVCVLDNLGFDFSSYSKYFEDFSGMKRRFQIVGKNEKVQIVDDYAHHPSEIKTTIDSIKDIKKRKVAIFQPHRYTRLKALWKDFLNSFDSIDYLYVLDTFNAGDKFDCEYNSKNFVLEIAKKGIKATHIEGTIEQASKKITPELKKDDIVLTLGAGDITEIGGMIDDLLAK